MIRRQSTTKETGYFLGCSNSERNSDNDYRANISKEDGDKVRQCKAEEGEAKRDAWSDFYGCMLIAFKMGLLRE